MTEKKYIKRKVSELIPNSIYRCLYNEEEPLKMEQMGNIPFEVLRDPIKIDGCDVILDGYFRWLGHKYHKIEEIECQVMHFDSEREKAIAIIGFNRRKNKSFSREYFEIDLFISTFTPEATDVSKANLKQYSDSPKLASMLINKAVNSGDLDRQEIDTTLNPSEQFEDIKDSIMPLIMDEQSKKNKRGIGSTRKLVGELTGRGGYTCEKIHKIGKMAENGDPIAITAVKNCDKKIWSIDQAFNIIEMEKVVESKVPGHIIAQEMIKEIQENPKNAGKVIKKWNKIKVPTASGEKYDILFTGAVYDPSEYRKKLLPMHPKTILFWLSLSTNVDESISLIKKWGFNYQDCIPVYVGEDNNCKWSQYKYNLLLVCTRDNFLPDETMKFPEIMNSFDDVRRGIEQVFPTQTKYELFRSDQLPGWGTPDKEKDEDDGMPSPASISRW
jgi:hypothetical protein